ncbi:MAG: phosphoglycerate mutase [Acidimicrobiales bacterium]|nr:MAG: phosphoglycerate mutase [Acidimicrobiales bacterium]
MSLPHGRLLLVRHAQSVWNSAGRWQGQEDPPLSNLGTRQAHEAAARLRATGVSFCGVVSSDLTRALETARILSHHLTLGKPVPDARLRERYAGPWQGLTREEIEERWPGWLQSGRRPPEFEGDAALVERVRLALIDAARIGDTVIVVTHGGAIRALERSLGADSEPLPNLAGRWFVLSDGELTTGPRVELTAEGRAGPPPPEL